MFINKYFALARTSFDPFLIRQMKEVYQKVNDRVLSENGAS